MQQPIIILGMHRSGTKLITKILNYLNVFVGNDLDENNESQFFYNLNDWAFFQAGATWDNPYNMNFLNDNFASEIAENFKKRFKSKMIKKYHSEFKKIETQNALWGWKDPRNTYTYPIWQKIFPEAKFIHIYRNPIDVAESLRVREEEFQKIKGSQTRTGLKKAYVENYLIKKQIYAQSIRVLDINEGIKLWQEYTQKALSINKNIMHIRYETLIEDTEEIVASLCNFINIPADYKTIKLASVEIDISRKFAFLNNPNLIEIYKSVKNNSLVRELNYDNIF